jgi:hypothetical protein
MKDKRRFCKNIIDIVNILDELDSLDSFWYSFIIEDLLDNLIQKYVEYEDDKLYDNSERLKSLKSQVVKWITINDGIISTNGKFFNLVKEGDYWMFGKINTDNYGNAEKIVCLINKLYDVYNDLRE